MCEREPEKDKKHPLSCRVSLSVMSCRVSLSVIGSQRHTQRAVACLALALALALASGERSRRQC